MAQRPREAAWGAVGTRLPELWGAGGEAATASGNMIRAPEGATRALKPWRQGSRTWAYGPGARVIRVADPVGVVVTCLLGHNFDLRYPGA